MKSTLRLCTAVTALALGALAAPVAFAQGTWNLGTSTTGAGNCNSGGTPGTASCGAGTPGSTGGVQASMTAWSNTGSGNTYVQSSLADNDPSGFGNISGANETSVGGHHAFDNITSNCGSGGSTQTGCGGSQEFMLVSFGSAKVNLSALQIGFSIGNADLSVYMWNGNSAANPNGQSSLGAGWVLVSSMDVFNNGANCTNANSGVVGMTAGNSGCKQMNTNDNTAGVVSSAANLYSSWWLISTYTGGAGVQKNLDATANDAFKILSFTANTCAGTITGGSSGTAGTSTANNGSSCQPSSGGAPEPGSLALAGLAMVGVLATRRRTLSEV